ncbi:MAG: hypothetical protein ACKPKO_21905 [Candidatus Fonsibacter sp.]
MEAPRLGLAACVSFYDLVAQVLHCGPVGAGHYTAMVLRHGLWWVCYDAHVRCCPKLRIEATGSDLCGLIYVRR